MQQTTTTERPPRAGGLLALIGGVIYLISSFISWGKPEVTTKGGFDFAVKVSGGGLALGVGAVLIVLGLLLIFVRSRGGRVALAIITILAGLAAAGFALIFVAGDDGFRTAWSSSCVDNQCIPRATDTDAVRKELDRATKSGDADFDAHPGVGIYLALVGGVIGLVGGIAGLRRGKTTATSGGYASPGFPPPPAYGQPGPAAPPAYGQPAPGATPPPATAPPATPPPATPPPQQPPPEQPSGGGGSYQP